MYCESCGTFIPDGQSFCSNCGAPVAQPAAQPAVQQQAAPAPAPGPAAAPIAAAPIAAAPAPQAVPAILSIKEDNIKPVSFPMF